ncbi:MAG: leucine-rich repeat domain-containing protein [Alphaproteobacteria bacterium]|nr:leucine-rich repeat domain-containing protein [Alphaproteobacteria bacterium]
MEKRIFVLMALFATNSVTASQYVPCSAEETVADTCFNCGTTCSARLTFENVEQDDGTTKSVGTLTLSGQGNMSTYSWTGVSGERTTTADWKSRIGEIDNLVVEDGITNIGYAAFAGTNIKHLELPQSVETIQGYAFMDGHLETINTLQNVTNIGSGAFYLTDLQSVDLSESLTRINSDVFTGTNLTSIHIPENVTSIGDYTFVNCTNLSEIDLPDNISQIGYLAFKETSLKIYCNDTDNRCHDLFFGDIDTGLNETQLAKYTVEDGKYLFDGAFYASKDDMKQGDHFSCGNSQAECNAVIAETTNGTHCNNIKSCRTILEMAEEGKYCNSIETCKDFINDFDTQSSVKIGNKIYTSLDNFIDGNYVKYRIYTIDEANRVAGEKNRVSIKYR